MSIVKAHFEKIPQNYLRHKMFLAVAEDVKILFREKAKESSTKHLIYAKDSYCIHL